MKRATYLIALVLLSATVKAQKATLFKFKYLPKHEYTITTKSGMDMDQVTTNDSANVAKTNPKAKKESNAVKMFSAWKASVKTAPETSSKGLTFTISGNNFSSKMSANGSEAPSPIDNILTGQTMTGTINDDGGYSLDTLSASYTTAPEGVRFAMMMIATECPGKIKFPDKPLQIGDTFTQEVTANTMNVVNLEFNQDLTVKQTYKLTAVKDNLVYFDITSEYAKDFTIQDKGRTIAGKTKVNGSGKLVFNIAEDFPQSIVSDDNVTMTLESGLKKMTITLKRTKDAQYVVKAN